MWSQSSCHLGLQSHESLTGIGTSTSKVAQCTCLTSYILLARGLSSLPSGPLYGYLSVLMTRQVAPLPLQAWRSPPGNIWQCLEIAFIAETWAGVCYKHLLGLGIQLNILQDTGQSLTTKLLSQNVNSAETEKPYLKASDPRKRKVEAAMSFMTYYQESNCHFCKTLLVI